MKSMRRSTLPLLALAAACALSSGAGPATNTPIKATQNPPPARQAQPVPLAFPQELSARLAAGNSPQVFSFYGTNLTDHDVKIIGYGASCGCTTVESAGETVPARGKLAFRAKLTKTRPAVEYAMILDEQTNMYQVIFKVTPAEKQ